MNIPHYARIIMLLVIYYSAVESSSTKTDENVRKNAASQLDRLTLFRKKAILDKSDDELKNNEKIVNNHLGEPKNSTNNDFTIPIELLQYISKHFNTDALANSPNQQNTQSLKESASSPKLQILPSPENPPSLSNSQNAQNLKNFPSKKRVDEILTDPTYNAIMVERIKRGGNSGSFLAGIASKLVGGIASASSGSSGASSSSSNTPYGHGYVAQQQQFDIWDFKKAVLNTLLQAVKAISGSVIALKGQIVKGGGFLISTKGKLISSAGEAISTLGRNLASSALIAPPKPAPQYPYHSDTPYNAHSDEFSSDLSAPAPSFGTHNADDSSEEFDAVKTTGTNIKEFNSDKANLALLDDNYGNPQKGISLAGLLSSSIEPPHQEPLHDHGLDNFPGTKPVENHSQLNYPNNFDPTFPSLPPIRDPATNLVNHILQETNLNYQHLNNLKYRPNNDFLSGSSGYNNYGKVQPNYAPNYLPPTAKPQPTESNIQPPQLPLLPHLNPEDLHKIQQFDRTKAFSSSGLPAPQEPLKIPLYQLDQPQNNNNWQNTQLQYPFRDHRQIPQQHQTSDFDIQASVDITPGEYRDGKFH